MLLNYWAESFGLFEKWGKMNIKGKVVVHSLQYYRAVFSESAVLKMDDCQYCESAVRMHGRCMWVAKQYFGKVDGWSFSCFSLTMTLLAYSTQALHGQGDVINVTANVHQIQYVLFFPHDISDDLKISSGRRVEIEAF